MANARQQRARKSHSRQQQMAGPNHKTYPKNTQAPVRSPIGNYYSEEPTNTHGRDYCGKQGQKGLAH